MESLAAFLSAKHTLQLGLSSDLRPLTKYSSPPEIYIQKQFNLADKDGGVKGVVDHEQIAQAIKDLNLMKAVKKPNGTGGFRMVMPASFWLGVEKKDIVARTKALGMNWVGLYPSMMARNSNMMMARWRYRDALHHRWSLLQLVEHDSRRTALRHRSS